MKDNTGNFRIKIKKNIYITFIVIGTFLLGCDASGTPGDKPIEPDENSYFLKYEGNEAPSVFPQYDKYYFTANEYARPIFVYGKNISSNATNFISRIAFEDIDPQECSQLAYTTTSNSYIVDGDNCYTMKLLIDGSFVDAGDGHILAYTQYENVSDSKSIEAIKIDDRELVINDYYYTKDSHNDKVFDILQDESNVTPRTVIKNVFDEAKIGVDFPFADKIIYYDGDIPLTSNYNIELWEYAKEKTELKSNLTNSKYIVLIGMNNYSTNGITLSFAGKTITNTEMPIVCFVFPDRLVSGLDAEQDIRLVVRTTAHELGHARGKFLTPRAADYNGFGDMQLLTNQTNDETSHTFGHYGNNKNFCIMSYLSSEDRITSSNNPHFCEGHIQMLLNTSFKLGD